MSKTPEFKFADTKQWPNLQQWLKRQLQDKLPGGPVYVRLGRENRTALQNAKMWPALRDISQQVNVRGEPLKEHDQPLTETEWKQVFMVDVRDEVKFVQTPGGNLLNLNLSTRELNKSEFADLITYIQIKGDEWGVQWSDPSLALFDEYREAQEATA